MSDTSVATMTSTDAPEGVKKEDTGLPFPYLREIPADIGYGEARQALFHLYREFAKRETVLSNRRERLARILHRIDNRRYHLHKIGNHLSKLYEYMAPQGHGSMASDLEAYEVALERQRKNAVRENIKNGISGSEDNDEDAGYVPGGA
jgi:hypothetical protein